MAPIEVLIYSHRGIGRQRILLLLHGNDSMVIPRASCYIVLLKEVCREARKTRHGRCLSTRPKIV
jgi:hypothetical protein